MTLVDGLVEDLVEDIANEDTKPFSSNASITTWWPNFFLIQVASPGGQISYKCKNFQQMNVVPPVD